MRCEMLCLSMFRFVQSSLENSALSWMPTRTECLLLRILELVSQHIDSRIRFSQRDPRIPQILEPFNSSMYSLVLPELFANFHQCPRKHQENVSSGSGIATLSVRQVK